MLKLPGTVFGEGRRQTSRCCVSRKGCTSPNLGQPRSGVNGGRKRDRAGSGAPLGRTDSVARGRNPLPDFSPSAQGPLPSSTPTAPLYPCKRCTTTGIIGYRFLPPLV